MTDSHGWIFFRKTVLTEREQYNASGSMRDLSASGSPKISSLETLNGMNVLEVSNATFDRVFASQVASGLYHVIAVMKWRSVSGYKYVWSGGGSYDYHGSSGGSALYDTASVSSYVSSAGHIFNGGASVNAATASKPVSWSIYRIDFSSSGLGAWRGSGFDSRGINREYDGYIAEIVLINAGVAGLAQKVEGYFAHKWGLASSLAQSHPYRDTPPLACGQGLHVEGGVCVADSRNCSLSNGSGQQTWNRVSGGWNACMATSCSPGFGLQSGACVPGCIEAVAMEDSDHTSAYVDVQVQPNVWTSVTFDISSNGGGTPVSLTCGSVLSLTGEAVTVSPFGFSTSGTRVRCLGLDVSALAGGNLTIDATQQDSRGELTCSATIVKKAMIPNCGSVVYDSTAKTITIPYTAGVAGWTYAPQAVQSTGVTGLVATLSGGVLGSSGGFVYAVTGEPSASGVANFHFSDIGGAGAGCADMVAVITVAWTPLASKSYFAGWYDVSAGASLIRSGNNVTQWRDLSNAARHLGPTNTPAVTSLEKLNGVDTLELNATEVDRLAASQVASGLYHVFGVMKWRSTSGYRNVWSGAGVYDYHGASGASPMYYTSYTAPYVSAASHIVNGGLPVATGSAVKPSGWAIYRIDFSTSKLGSWRGSGFDSRGFNREYDGFLAEVLLVNANVSGLGQKVEGYLAHKWGLAGSLPETHPFKSVPPLSY